jgi:hypothetical protein
VSRLEPNVDHELRLFVRPTGDDFDAAATWSVRAGDVVLGEGPSLEGAIHTATLREPEPEIETDQP